MDYTENILRDVLSHGIADPDIQLELLGHTKQDMSLEEVFQFVETKEAGKRSASRLLGQHAAAIKSSYQKTRKENTNLLNGSNKPNTARCSHCGLNTHSSHVQTRKESCPAYNHTCGHCHRLHHYDHVCRSKDKK